MPASSVVVGMGCRYTSSSTYAAISLDRDEEGVALTSWGVVSREQWVAEGVCACKVGAGGVEHKGNRCWPTGGVAAADVVPVGHRYCIGLWVQSGHLHIVHRLTEHEVTDGGILREVNLKLLQFRPGSTYYITENRSRFSYSILLWNNLCGIGILLTFCLAGGQVHRHWTHGVIVPCARLKKKITIKKINLFD